MKSGSSCHCSQRTLASACQRSRRCLRLAMILARPQAAASRRWARTSRWLDCMELLRSWSQTSSPKLLTPRGFESVSALGRKREKAWKIRRFLTSRPFLQPLRNRRKNLLAGVMTPGEKSWTALRAGVGTPQPSPASQFGSAGQQAAGRPCHGSRRDALGNDEEGGCQERSLPYAAGGDVGAQGTASRSPLARTVRRLT